MTGAEFLRKLKVVAKSKGVTLEIDSRRGKGSHQVVFFGGRKTVITDLKREMKTGTLNGMIKQLGLTGEDLR